jgi:hypothetical protein
MLDILYMIIPQLGMFAAVALKQMNHYLVYNPYLAIGLWMESDTSLHVSIHHCPQDFPKISKESSVLIRDNGCGESKVEPYMLKERISNFLSNDLLFTWHQDTHLAKPIRYYIQVVMTSF